MSAPLSEHDVLPARSLRRLGSSRTLLLEVDSTNRYLLDLCEQLPDGAIALAEMQSAGRGRLGRRWLAPRGSSVLASVLLIEPARSPLRPIASMLAAVAACRAVADATRCTPELRWPNDLTIGGRKLGGVLVETRARGASGESVAMVIGVGLNCLQQAAHFPESLRSAATSLEMESSEPVDRAAVARALIERLDELIALPEPLALEAVRGEWLGRCRDLGRRVALQHDTQRLDGTILDIAPSGDLLVHSDQAGRVWLEAAHTTRIHE